MTHNETRISNERLAAIEHGLSWVDAALACKSWVWDGDQRDAAEIELAAAREAVQALRSTPVEAEPVCKTCNGTGNEAPNSICRDCDGKD